MLKATLHGLTLACERIGRGRPLVLLHGYPLDHTIWEGVISLLQDSFDLILPDLRGFGQSQSSPTPYTMDVLAADIAAWLNYFNLSQAYVAGHSMGGYVALAFARLFPQRLLGLGLIASQAAADTLERRQARYQSIEQIRSEGVHLVAQTMAERLSANPSLRPSLERLIRKQRPEGLMGALQAMAERPDSTGWLQTVRFPLILIHGQADVLIPVERGREIATFLPQAQLIEIPDVGHMPMLEAPSETALALKRFLAIEAAD